ncbi:MAG: sugar-binding transcriptional regulator [Candidatus Humimicrobiaceae bacterium]
MSNYNYDLDILLKVCNLKYKEKIPQKEIAKQLKLSTAKVSRLLQKAFELDIAKVIINDSNLKITKIEGELEKKYDLKRVLIAKSDNRQPNESKRNIGQKLAGYLLTILKDKDYIGITHSSTIKEVIESLPIEINKNVNIVQMCGGSYNMHFAGLDQTKEFSDKFGVLPHTLFAPLVVDNSKIKNAIMQDSSLKLAFDYFKNINVALVGLGSFYPLYSSTIFRSAKLSEEEIEELKEQKVVGDIFGHFFNENGNFCDTSIEKRIITIPIEIINKIEFRICAAGGMEKLNAIHSALKGKLIDVLATDEIVGEKLFSLDN